MCASPQRSQRTRPSRLVADTAERGPSNFYRATREHVDLVTTAKQLLEEHYALYGSFPSVAWLLEQLGLRA